MFEKKITHVFQYAWFYLNHFHLSITNEYLIHRFFVVL